MHDDTFNYRYENGRLLVGGENTSEWGNGALNKEIVEAFLPAKYNNTLIYGTAYRCLGHLQNLTRVFIPRTYKLIGADLCLAVFTGV